VKELLLECNENLVELPYHMMQVLKNTGHTPDTISPKMICKKLRNSQAWHSYSSNKKLNLAFDINLSSSPGNIFTVSSVTT
jgi:hypothetical protein